MNKKMGRRFKAALAGYYGFKNLGDELLLQASINALERAGVSRNDIIILSNNPEETEKFFEINAVSRWNFKDVKSALRSSEKLILGGGGIFQDSTSVKSCVWYWGLIKLAKFCGTEAYAIGQSIGPLKSFWGRFFAESAFKSLKLLHVRDMPSLYYAEIFKLKNVISGHDLALTLDFNFNLNNNARPEDNKNNKIENNNNNIENILLNLRPHKNIADFINQAKLILDKYKNIKNNIIGVALSPEDAELLDKIKNDGIIKISRIEILDNINKLNNKLNKVEKLWQNAEFAVGMRLHFCVLSFIFNTPFQALSYDPKVSAFSQWADENKNNLKNIQKNIKTEIDDIFKNKILI